MHLRPFNTGIEPVWYSGEKQMRTEIKLVQNTHWSLQCWYRTSLVFTRKTNANTNQTGIKYTLLDPYNAGIQNQSGIQKKNKCLQKSNWWKRHTAPYSASIESVWYSEEKQCKQESNQCKNTHWSLQCWYRTILVFRRKQMRTGIKMVQKYTLVPIMLVQNQSGIVKKTKCQQ